MLLKFGGDALMLLFSDDDPAEHAARAARAAHGMRKTAPHGRQARDRRRQGEPAHVGRRALRHVRLLPGRRLAPRADRDRPAATQVVTMEGTADAGEIVVSPALAERLAPVVRGRAEGSRLLAAVGARRANPRRRSGRCPRSPTTSCSASVPVATREHLLAGITEPEHRQASVAFVHFDGTDEMIAREGPRVGRGGARPARARHAGRGRRARGLLPRLRRRRRRRQAHPGRGGASGHRRRRGAHAARPATRRSKASGRSRFASG